MTTSTTAAPIRGAMTPDRDGHAIATLYRVELAEWDDGAMSVTAESTDGANMTGLHRALIRAAKIIRRELRR